MRRYTKALLLMLVALLYAGTAGAYSMSLDAAPGPYGPSDTLTVDVMLDSEGAQMYGFVVYVVQDPGVFSPNFGASARHGLPGEDGGSLYLYASGDAWYISSTVFAGVPSAAQSVATLVFHVISDPGTSVIDINFDYGIYGGFAGEGATDVTGQVVLTSLHVPEPTTTMLMGLGLLGILYAGRRR
jgi:hypothetical protein